jgi:hypothetical protein
MNGNETIIVLLHEIIFIEKSTLPSFAKNFSLLTIQIQDTTIFIVLNIKPKENSGLSNFTIFISPFFFKLAENVL